VPSEDGATVVDNGFRLTPLRRILLRDGDLTVGIAPECGGALASFETRVDGAVVDILRRADERPTGRPCALGASSFPLVPYSGRLRDGRFQFDGRDYHYPLNALPESHTSHGDGWTRRWQLVHLGRRAATMSLEPDEAAPLRYRCTQVVSVQEALVRVALTVQNLEERRMPFGIGLHPYFANRALAIIKARLPTRWRWDHELMPLCTEPNQMAASFQHGQRASTLPVACEYAEWNGVATIEWPTLRVRVDLRTTPPLRHVVMWMPDGETFFCFEPVSHATDALNSNAGHPAAEDFVILEPAASFTQQFDFLVSAG